MKYRFIIFILLLSTLFRTIPVKAQEEIGQQAFVGSWVTVIPDSVSADSVNRLLLHIERAKDGSYTATVDSPNQYFFDIPFTEIVVFEDSLSLKMKSPSVQYAGQLAATPPRIEGKWKTANQSSRKLFKPLTDSIVTTLPKNTLSPDKQRPKTKAADVKTPETIIEAAYDVISGPADEERNWDRLRSLFLPNARLIPTARMGGKPQYRSYLVEEYIENALKDLAEKSFYEYNIHAETERFGDMAHVFSAYESRRSPNAEPFAHGINSFQLWFDGNRWWIVNLMWHTEQEGLQIPEHYLD